MQTNSRRGIPLRDELKVDRLWIGMRGRGGRSVIKRKGDRKAEK